MTLFGRRGALADQGRWSIRLHISLCTQSFHGQSQNYKYSTCTTSLQIQNSFIVITLVGKWSRNPLPPLLSPPFLGMFFPLFLIPIFQFIMWEPGKTFPLMSRDRASFTFPSDTEKDRFLLNQTKSAWRSSQRRYGVPGYASWHPSHTLYYASHSALQLQDLMR